MDGWIGLSGCGCGKCKVDVDGGKWRGSGSHTTLEGKFEWTPFIVHVILMKKTIYAEKYAEKERGERWKFSVKYN